MSELVERLRAALPLIDGLETGQDCEEYAFATAAGFQAMTYCPEAFEALRALPDAIDHITRLEADRVELIERLEGLIDDEPCRLDHSGNCQAHFITSPCEMAQARKTLSRIQGCSDA